jgi:hypothetical protein
LADSTTAISSVFFREEARVQRPVYYISKILKDAETRYIAAEKLAFALLITARRLRPYFQAHSIHVLTDQPFKQVLAKPDSSGRLVKWSIKLSEFDIHYVPRTVIKGQVLADFLVKMQTPIILPEEMKPSAESYWELRADGSSTAGGSGVGLMLMSLGGARLEYALCLNFPATNNAAEYETIIA